ncbi:hypothetical protein F5J12DRAFT_842271 [Pisolithus orientalis]|uniref:uncharacterized protein n=1 Tax=Pisolithus orientalis TaxID=936130 RepID=UPI002224D6BA|nr:uncharacterized protein F5J12DRAFT_842271 [Pisolithus orientalis]KAI6002286.1 hypothetical protein F5J12DRAFT_842271 [Pisolithus orientalis]
MILTTLLLLMFSLYEKLSLRTAPDRVYAKDTLPVHNDFNASPRYTPLRSMLSTIVLPICSLYSFFGSLSNFFFHRKDRNSLPEERSAGRSRELPRSATRAPFILCSPSK